MCKLVCVTAQKLCRDDFLHRIEILSKSEIDKIILREKYLSEDEYYSLAKKLLSVCNPEKLVIHNFDSVAIRLGIQNIHLPFEKFKDYNISKSFDAVGTSVHSIEDAIFAEAHGANYVTAGHIFDTDCKKGLKGRGVKFLQNVCDSINISVYAIGGINESTACQLKTLKSKSFAGACVMSELMQAENVAEKVKNIMYELG